MPTDITVHEMYMAYSILDFKETDENELFLLFLKSLNIRHKGVN